MAGTVQLECGLDAGLVQLHDQRVRWAPRVRANPNCSDAQVTAARVRGEEYLLTCWIFLWLSTGEIADQAFTQFSFSRPATTSMSCAASTTSGPAEVPLMRGRMTLSRCSKASAAMTGVGCWRTRSKITPSFFGEAAGSPESWHHAPRAARPSLARRSPRLTGE